MALDDKQLLKAIKMIIKQQLNNEVFLKKVAAITRKQTRIVLEQSLTVGKKNSELENQFNLKMKKQIQRKQRELNELKTKFSGNQRVSSSKPKINVGYEDQPKAPTLKQLFGKDDDQFFNDKPQNYESDEQSILNQSIELDNQVNSILDNTENFKKYHNKPMQATLKAITRDYSKLIDNYNK